MNYKAIVSDFDGTLAGKDWQISPKVKSAISMWLNSGKHFSICTGKQYKHIAHAVNELKLTDLQIVRGGSEIVDPKTGNVIFSEYIDTTSLKNLIPLLLNSSIPFTAEGGEILYTITGESFSEVPDVKYEKMSNIDYNNIAKIVLWTDNVEEAKVENLIDAKIKDNFPEIEMIKSYTPFQKTWQITSIKATKETAIYKLINLLQIEKEEIIGIGDSYNDAALLKACGYKVAMGNSPEELKSIADFITPSFEDDGAAFVIEKLLT